MAMFREHVAFGAIISILIIGALYFYALVTDPVLLVFLLGVTIVGSFLPDVDSDSGMPFYLVFGSMTLAATAVVLLYTLNSTYASDWRYLTGIPAAALLIFWYIVGGVVKRCTHHRGMFHSVPALLIAGLGSFLVARSYGLSEEIAWIFGGAMAAGYLSHLVLDELHSSITLDGVPFNPKGSEGTALKLFSRSTRVNVATYLLLAALAYIVLQPVPAEAYYNDSDVIELEGEAPAQPEQGQGAEGSGGAVGGPGSGSGGTGSPGGSSITGGGSGGSATGSAGGLGSASAGDADEGDLLGELIGSGAITGLEGSGGAGGADAASISGNGTLTIVGQKVRQALSRRGDLQDILQSWKVLRGKGKAGARDLGLVAASTALGDENVQEVVFTADAFSIKYRSRGYLLGIFPWTFPVSVHVIPQATEGSRVSVRLPWYRFFVREFFTPQGLAGDIENSLKASLAAAEEASDERTLLFEAVANLLREKVGTVSNSILLGE